MVQEIKDVEKTEETVEKTKEEEAQEQAQNLATFLEGFNGAPSKEQIETWKQQYGDVFCSGFSEVELFVWRPLNRKEYVEMQTILAQAESQVTAQELEERIVRQCILWGSELGMSGLVQKAGSLTTLHEQILQNSNFMNPAVAASLVIKL